MKNSINTSTKIPFIIIERFAKKNGISLQFSIELHHQLITYLDEGREVKSKNHSPSLLVDEVWHGFILHTADYHLFCKERYGHFVHHVPLSFKYNKYSNFNRIVDDLNFEKSCCIPEERTKIKQLLALENITCNSGGEGANGQCSDSCGQHNCSDTGG